MNRVFLTPAAVALCGASSLSLAEPVSLADQVVTATRTAQTASQSLAAVSVIDREDIERSQARSVPELLRQVPGVSLANNGGFGKNTTLFLRGTESDHVLVLIDGIKVGSASAGLTAFGFAGGADRAHRGGPRAAFQPVRLGGHRRGDPDLHPARRRPGRQAVLLRRLRHPSDPGG
ncbi:TonB-dependent receptor plug domain-containing protein [Pseudomonas aeruginosa]